MKKIMFNDKYGLTEAVLERRKTQTRRILNPTMLFERLNTYEGWKKEDIADWKESCKDRLYKAEGEELKEMLDYALKHSLYKVGENVAIAQRYIDLADNDYFYRLCGIHGMLLECIKYEKGFNNKMFIRADLMPHHIRITKIRMERLQDISDDDCLKEGICRSDIKNTLWGVAPIRGEGESGTTYEHSVLGYGPWHLFPSVKRAYASLIDRISGKCTWANNPYVFVYDFELL